jgi:FMN-dependent NADH-azoreductase
VSTLLHIAASPRGTASQSLHIAETFPLTGDPAQAMQDAVAAARDVAKAF